MVSNGPQRLQNRHDLPEPHSSPQAGAGPHHGAQGWTSCPRAARLQAPLGAHAGRARPGGTTDGGPCRVGVQARGEGKRHHPKAVLREDLGSPPSMHTPQEPGPKVSQVHKSGNSGCPLSQWAPTRHRKAGNHLSRWGTFREVQGVGAINSSWCRVFPRGAAMLTV